ncbi:MAG: hypothetical protein ACREAY_04155 [Nitrososphaera sp.]|uniref:hypothetical protein n=1 Tax=Nitrososphaera sp. TaxID=1971748 RepID=UPI003D6E3293
MTQYAGFPVYGTIPVRDVSDIRQAADRMADAYEKSSDDFAFRILLPRGDKLTNKAKKLGMTFQGEFVLTLRKRNLVPVVRDVRYVHDDDHYGWILASPKAFDRFEGKAT